MAKNNKLRINQDTISANRYVKGLSIAEFEDVEDAVNEALEDPTGTFSMSTRTTYIKMSAIHKDVRSIKRDTLYIRKGIDDLKKNLLNLSLSGSGIDLGLNPRNMTRGAAGAGIMSAIRKAIIPLLGGFVAHELDKDTSKAGNSAVGSWVNENIPGAAYIDDWVYDNTGGYVGTDMDDPRYSWNKNKKKSGGGTQNFMDRIGKEPMSKNVEDRRVDNITRQRVAFQDRQSPARSAIKELNPSERAAEISKRMKMMTQTGQPYMNELGEMVGRGGQVAVGGGAGASYSGMGASSNPVYTRQNSVGGSSGGGGQYQDQLGPAQARVSAESIPKDKKEVISQVYNSFISAGYSPTQAQAMTSQVGRENDFNPKYMYGVHKDANNGAMNLGFFSWQKERAPQLYAYMKSKGVIDEKGNIIPGQAALNAQAEFTKMEIENNPAYKRTKEQFLNNPNIGKEEALEVLGNNYIRWDRAGKKIDTRPHRAKESNYYDLAGSIATTNPSATPVETLSPTSAGGSPQLSQTASNAGGLTKVNESYGSRRPGRPDESIRNAAQQAATAVGMPEINFTSGKGNWISESGRRKGQKTTMHSTGLALDVAGFQSDEQRLKFIEEATARGVKGIGVYKDGSIHIDYGKKRSWSWGGIPADKLNQAIARGEEKKAQLASQQPGTIGPQGTQLTEASIVETPQVPLKRDLIGFSRGKPAAATVAEDTPTNKTKGYTRVMGENGNYRLKPNDPTKQDAMAREMLDNMIAGQKKPSPTVADVAPVSESNKVWNGIKKWWNESNMEIPKGNRHGFDYNYASGMSKSPNPARVFPNVNQAPGVNGFDYDYASGKSRKPIPAGGVGFTSPDLRINFANSNRTAGNPNFDPKLMDPGKLKLPPGMDSGNSDERIQKILAEMRAEIGEVKKSASRAEQAVGVATKPSPSAPVASQGYTNPPRTFKKAILTTAKPAMNPTDGTQGSTTTNIDTSYKAMQEMMKPQLVADGPSYQSLQASIAAQQ